ncbi:protein MAIN-LIKE 2-like [Arachis hypogaea]|uniref:protein MAIN-LIKE 2-like n=1 Tax=Arachis hypogaea TaxID=3818 RepID=UPI000DEC28BF|nr:protein MAIN-LIKE 2-like [Arachis hypogaea]
MRETRFEHAVELRNFMFDGCLISAFVEWWRPETHTFHLSWGETSITLQDVAYHIGLRTADESVGGCNRDFQLWHQHPTWEWVENLLGAMPPSQKWGGKQVFAVRMMWLRDQVAHISDGAASETLRQYIQCYLMMLIGGFLFTDKSATIVPLRWLSLLEDFD